MLSLSGFFRALSGHGSTAHLENFQERNDFESGFALFYREHLREHVINAERLRLHYQKIVLQRFLVAGGAAIAGLFWLFRQGGGGVPPFIFLVVGGLAFMLLLIWAFLPIYTYSNHVKERIFRPIFRHLGDFSFSSQGEESAAFALRFQKAGLLPSRGVCETEDHVSGHYRKVSFHMEEASFRRYRRGRERFHGLLLAIDCPKPFYGVTLLLGRQKSLPKSLRSYRPPLSRVFLKDPAMAMEYSLYATDKEEAGYLLINAFVERLGLLGNVFASYNKRGRRRVECCFIEKTLLITVECRHNLFEMESVFKPVDMNDLRLMIAQVHRTFKLIDTLFHKLEAKG